MRREIRVAMIAVAVSLAPVAKAQQQFNPSEAALAHSAAFDATIFGYPLDGMYQMLTREVLDPATRKTGFNEYFHLRQLATPENSPFPAPNNDTLYSTAWIDLRTGPAILSMPDTGGRYYTAHIMDFATDTIANVGKRLDGTGAGSFAIAGPEWKGHLPATIKRVIRSNTVFALVLLRLLVDGPDDVQTATSLQDQFKIASLSRFERGETGIDATDPPPPYQANSPAERLAMLDRVLRMNPVRVEDKGIVASFATIGVGPESASIRIVPPAHVLAGAEREARTAISWVGLHSGKIVNGWRMPAAAIGQYGVDYLQRASVWDGGPLANTTDESFYPTAIFDSEGQQLDGKNARYVLRFASGELPPASVFWSLTMYRLSDSNLVKNPIHRYSIGDRTRELVRGADGSLTIAIQADPPPAGDGANWLPAPEVPFFIVLRMYGASRAALDGAWVPPAVQRLQ